MFFEVFDVGNGIMPTLSIFCFINSSNIHLVIFFNPNDVITFYCYHCYARSYGSNRQQYFFRIKNKFD